MKSATMPSLVANQSWIERATMSLIITKIVCHYVITNY